MLIKMNKDIQTLIEREAFEHWSQSNYKEVAEKAHSENDMCKTSAMARKVSNSSFKSGANFALSLFKWRKVSEELPEEIPLLLDNHIPDVECTLPVLVKDEEGHVYENRRVKMLIGNKEWKWYMIIEGDTNFTEWMPIPQID